MQSIVRTEQGAVLALDPHEAQNMAAEIARALETGRGTACASVHAGAASAPVAPVLPGAAADRRALAQRSADPRPHRPGGGARLTYGQPRDFAARQSKTLWRRPASRTAPRPISSATRLVAARGLRGLVGVREVEVTVAMTATGPRQTSARRPAPVESDDAPSIGATPAAGGVFERLRIGGRRGARHDAAA